MEHNRQCWPMLGINQMTLEWANWFLCCSSLRPESWSVGNLYSLYTYVHVSPSSTLFHPLSPIWNHTICVVRFCSDASRMAAECFRICSSSLIFPAFSSIQQHPAASSSIVAPYMDGFQSRFLSTTMHCPSGRMSTM